jgi:phosphoribosylformylglycinamidine synthase
MVKTLIITGNGINSEAELAEAFRQSGSAAEFVHINDLAEKPEKLANYDILALPGGFSFGDHLGSGLVLAQLIKQHLKSAIQAFTAAGGLILGICNGFQILVKAGILPDLEGNWTPEISLIHNDCGTFQDRWIKLEFNPESPCVWTKGLKAAEYPIRHGEGRLIIKDEQTKNELIHKNLVAIRYSDGNPNGSELDAAGISDASGRILGLMPHPEAYLCRYNHPEWTGRAGLPPLGLELIKNGVEYINKNRK